MHLVRDIGRDPSNPIITVRTWGREAAGFECDAGHTPSGIGPLLVCHFRDFAEAGRRVWRAAMPRNNLEVRLLPRVELDQRAREARLRLGRAERLVRAASRPDLLLAQVAYFRS